MKIYENHAQDARYDEKDTCPTITSRYGTGGGNVPLVLTQNQIGEIRCSETTAPTLTGQANASARNHPLVLQEAYRISSDSSNCMKSGNPHSGINHADISPTLDTTDPSPSKAQGGLVILSKQGGALPHVFKLRSGKDGGGKGYLGSDDLTFTLATNNDQYLMTTEPYMLAGNMIGRSETSGPQGKGYRQGQAFTLNATDVQGVAQARVRKLTPRECERLQGFPDDYTKIPYRGKSAEDCPDSPRYKAIGNSWAVPCVHWIGERIQKELEKNEVKRQRIEEN